VVLLRAADRGAEGVLNDGLDEWVVLIVGARGDAMEVLCHEKDLNVLFCTSTSGKYRGNHVGQGETMIATILHLSKTNIPHSVEQDHVMVQVSEDCLGRIELFDSGRELRLRVDGVMLPLAVVTHGSHEGRHWYSLAPQVSHLPHGWSTHLGAAPPCPRGAARTDGVMVRAFNPTDLRHGVDQASRFVIVTPGVT
jgi:hypothetical protein